MSESPHSNEGKQENNNESISLNVNDDELCDIIDEISELPSTFPSQSTPTKTNSSIQTENNSKSFSQSPIKPSQSSQNVYNQEQNSSHKQVSNQDEKNHVTHGDNSQFLQKQVYFWKKCYEDCQKDILKLQEALHLQKTFRDEKDINSVKSVSRTKPLSNGNISSDEYSKKRKRKEDIYDKFSDIPSFEEVNRIRMESIKNQIRYETLKSVLLHDNNNNNMNMVPALCKVIKELNASVNTLRDSIIEDNSLKEQLANAKKKILTLESQISKYKHRIEELEKSLKEVLVHILENDQTEDNNPNRDDEKKKEAIDECMKDLNGVVDVLNETNAPVSGVDSS